MAATSSSDPLVLKAEGSGGSGGETSEVGVGVTMVGNSNKDELMAYRGVKKAKKERGCTAKERISKMPPCAAGKRSSIYRGVTRHRWTGRYEAHLWDKSTWNQNQNKKGKQVYLGAYDDEEAAARAYDLAALKYWGPGTLINFPVTDYARDLEEMQNLSREDYLASLRRKSSGFSRGISKYRGVSRWDSSFGHMTGADYYNRVHYGAGDDGTTESEILGGFSMDRKIDLTSYIKWWGHNKTRQTDVPAKSSEETKRGEDISSELKALEWVAGPSEPYQMPRLGVSIGTRHKGSPVSATNILLRSAAYKSLQQKSLKKEEMNSENDENENKTSINKLDYGKAIDKSSSDDCPTEGFGAALGMGGGGLPLQRDAYPLAPFLSAPLLTNYNSISVPLSDPILWTSIAPVLPIRASRAPEVTKTETSSDYTFFQQE